MARFVRVTGFDDGRQFLVNVDLIMKAVRREPAGSRLAHTALFSADDDVVAMVSELLDQLQMLFAGR